MSAPAAIGRIAFAAIWLGAACAAPGPSTRANASTFPVTTELPNGRVEIDMAPSYDLGSVIAVPVVIVSRGATIAGPLRARVLASGIGGAGAASEVLIRDLAVAPVTVSAGQRRTVGVSWDGRDAHRVLVPADAYSLVLDLRVDDGGVTKMATAGATLVMRDP